MPSASAVIRSPRRGSPAKSSRRCNSPMSVCWRSRACQAFRSRSGGTSVMSRLLRWASATYPPGVGPACHASRGRPGPVRAQLVNPWLARAVVTVMMVADVMTTDTRLGPGLRLVLRVTGAGLLIATAAIHLDLYLTGYRTIPTIGPLFLFQVIVAFALGGLVLVTGWRLAAAAGALFALSTLGGYLITVQFGLFGFREVRTTAGIVAAILEVLAFAALAVLAALPGRRAAAHTRGSPDWLTSRGDVGFTGMQTWAAVAAISVVALGLTAGALAGAGSSAASPPS